MGHGSWVMRHWSRDMRHGTWAMCHVSWDMGHGPWFRPPQSVRPGPSRALSFSKIAYKLKNNERQSQVVLKSTGIQKRLPDSLADLNDISEVDASPGQEMESRAHPAVLPSEVALSKQFPAGALPTCGAVEPLRASGALPRDAIK